MTLLQETIELLRADQRDLGTIADGADVGREWLSKLKRDLIADPGVVKIQRLNKYLKKGRKRVVAA